jgi:glycosyltransferase involved in cell wall biosynthesis
MPRVLRILNRLVVGGPVLNAVYLSRYLPSEFETLLVVGEKESHEQSAEHLATSLGIDYVTINGMGRALNPFTDYNAYTELKKLIKKYRPDIVHTHAAKPGTLGRLAAHACGVPVILHTFHGHVFHSYFNPIKTQAFIEIEKFLARRSDAIIAISNQQKKELVTDFRIAAENKFRVIPLGFDLDKFATGQEEKRITFRNEFNLQDDEIAIGITGRLVPVKNHSLFLKAISYLLKNSQRKIKAFIIGDGDTRKALETEATSLSINFNTEKDVTFTQPLIFTSWRSDIDTINAGLDIVTLTSLNEGTPVSLIEAQASNKPIVSTRVGGISDIVLENKTALLSDINDPDTFCANLLRLVENDSLRTEMAVAGREHVMERFSYRRLMNDMSQLYHELLQKKKS